VKAILLLLAQFQFTSFTLGALQFLLQLEGHGLLVLQLPGGIRRNAHRRHRGGGCIAGGALGLLPVLCRFRLFEAKLRCVLFVKEAGNLRHKRSS
jgi:hypothetical protein